jgi:hypothetical protein
MGNSPVYEMTTTPLAATEWLIQHPDTCSTLWADYAFGGYLSFVYFCARMDSRCHSRTMD